MRLIDAKTAEEIIWNRSEEMSDKEPELSGALAAAIGFLDKCPTIEAVPVVHSKWYYRMEQEAPDMGDGWKEATFPTCKHCEETNVAGKTEFCPDCGAKMDLEGDKTDD